MGEHELYAGGSGRRSEVDPERGETWVRFDKLFGRDLTLKVGRQNFEEPRRWWWDDDLDAVGVRYRREPWFFELGVGRELARKSLDEGFIEPENEGIIRLLARANWRYFKNHGLDLFFLHQNDRSATPPVGTLVRANREDPSDARLWWGGVRAMGSEAVTQYGELSYWADTAVVLGNEKLLEFSNRPVTKNLSLPVKISECAVGPSTWAAVGTPGSPPGLCSLWGMPSGLATKTRQGALIGRFDRPTCRAMTKSFGPTVSS